MNYSAGWGQDATIRAGRLGAGDEGTRSDSASDGEEDHLVWQAAEVIGISHRSLRRWRGRYEQSGYDGLFDRRRGKPSPKRVPVETVEEVLRLYQERYHGFNVRHFHEKLREEHGIELSHTCGARCPHPFRQRRRSR